MPVHMTRSSLSNFDMTSHSTTSDGTTANVTQIISPHFKTTERITSLIPTPRVKRKYIKKAPTNLTFSPNVSSLLIPQCTSSAPMCSPENLISRKKPALYPSSILPLRDVVSSNSGSDDDIWRNPPKTLRCTDGTLQFEVSFSSPVTHFCNLNTLPLLPSSHSTSLPCRTGVLAKRSAHVVHSPIFNAPTSHSTMIRSASP